MPAIAKNARNRSPANNLLSPRVLGGENRGELGENPMVALGGTGFS